MKEVISELQAACDLNYIETEQLDPLRPRFRELTELLSNLSDSLKNQTCGKMTPKIVS